MASRAATACGLVLMLALAACTGDPASHDGSRDTAAQAAAGRAAVAGSDAAPAASAALTEAEVRAFYAPLDAIEGALDAERACGMLARAFEGRFETRHPDGSTTTRVVGRDQTCNDARAGAVTLRSALEKGPPPEGSHVIESVTIGPGGASAEARYVQRFALPGRLEIVVRGTDTLVREDGRLLVLRSVGRETIRDH